MTDKQLLLVETGLAVISDFAKVNGIKMPKINIIDKPKRANYCGVYHGNKKSIDVLVKRCANLAKVPGFSWSHPGYFVDRTPFGVICHEFGHHVDNMLNRMKGMPKYKGEKVSGYEPNACERFAESMKLFLSNPDLLKKTCPKRYEFLTKKLGLVPCIEGTWKEVFEKNCMHDKYYAAAEKRIKEK